MASRICRSGFGRLILNIPKAHPPPSRTLFLTPPRRRGEDMLDSREKARLLASVGTTAVVVRGEQPSPKSTSRSAMMPSWALGLARDHIPRRGREAAQPCDTVYRALWAKMSFNAVPTD